MSKEMVIDLCRLYAVPRWIVVPMFRQQSVAEHSFRVAAIAFDLASHSSDIDPNAKYKIAWLSLIHDGAEAETGDIPGNVKEVAAGLEKLEAEFCPWVHDREKMPVLYHHFVKYADAIEAVCWFQKYHVPSPRAEWVRDRLVKAANRASVYLGSAVMKRGDEIIHMIMNDMEVVNGQDTDHNPQGGQPQGQAAGEGKGSLEGYRGGNLGGPNLRAVPPRPPVGGGPDSGTDIEGPKSGI